MQYKRWNLSLFSLQYCIHVQGIVWHIFACREWWIEWVISWVFSRQYQSNLRIRSCCVFMWFIGFLSVSVYFPYYWCVSLCLCERLCCGGYLSYVVILHASLCCVHKISHRVSVMWLIFYLSTGWNRWNVGVLH